MIARPIVISILNYALFLYTNTILYQFSQRVMKKRSRKNSQNVSYLIMELQMKPAGMRQMERNQKTTLLML